ncbi:MAG: hypothetical protein M1815_001888 [Lichina confinis]|nr:MAG: hypothetical protein M1815_001888 [Lichina confinis]
MCTHPIEQRHPLAAEDPFLLLNDYGIPTFFNAFGPMAAPGFRHAIIDLTGDEPDPAPLLSARGAPNNADPASTRASRPPNFERDIIDVDALPDQPEQRAAQLRPPSPDLQVVGARQVFPSSRWGQPAGVRPVQQGGLGGAMAFFHHQMTGSLASGPSRVSGGGHPHDHAAPSSTAHSTTGAPRRVLGDPVQFGAHLLERIHEDGLRRGGSAADMETFMRRREILAAEGRRRQGFGDRNGTIPGGFSGVVIADGPFPEGFDMPNLSYETVAFRPHGTSTERPPTPPPAQTGFTRSPDEEQLIVCPNCDDELGVGQTDEKRSVWFVKGCGHVYCGECVHNRSVGKRRRDRKGKGEPFKLCKVCQRSVSSKMAFRQIFI